MNLDGNELSKVEKRLDEVYKAKRNIITKILILKSGGSIIDQLFQQEIKSAEEKHKQICSSCCYKQPIDPTQVNSFIKYILDPFSFQNELEERLMYEKIISRHLEHSSPDMSEIEKGIKRYTKKKNIMLNGVNGTIKFKKRRTGCFG